MNPKTRRGVVQAGACFLLLYGGWQAWLWWLRNEPLERAAEKVATAFENQDLGPLWNYSHDGEKDAFGLDRNRFATVFEQYVWPAATGLKVDRSIRDLSPDKLTFTLTRIYRKGSTEIVYSVVMFRTKEGPRANVISPAIFAVFWAKYGEKNKDLPVSKRYWQTRLDAALGERQTLEQLGIRGTKDSAPGKPMIPWDLDIKTLSDYLNARPKSNSQIP